MSKITFKIENVDYDPSTDTLITTVARCDEVESREVFEIEMTFEPATSKITDVSPGERGDTPVSYPAEILYVFARFFENAYLEADAGASPNEALTIGQTFAL